MSWGLAFFIGIAVVVAVLAYVIYFQKDPFKIVTKHPSLSHIVEPIKPSGKEAAPVTGICGMCGKQVTMPFKCKFCKGLYCDEHRLPEDHACDGM
jgi:predicted nucleic acid binding AN1-type Zn finger protein